MTSSINIVHNEHIRNDLIVAMVYYKQGKELAFHSENNNFTNQNLYYRTKKFSGILKLNIVQSIKI